MDRKPTKTENLKYLLQWGLDYVVYGCSFTDYFSLGFYRIKAKEKLTYHTLRFAKKFDQALDSPHSITLHNSKIYEYRHLKNTLTEINWYPQSVLTKSLLNLPGNIPYSSSNLTLPIAEKGSKGSRLQIRTGRKYLTV